MQDKSIIKPKTTIEVLNSSKWWDRFIGAASHDPSRGEVCDAIDLAVTALAVMQDQKK